MPWHVQDSIKKENTHASKKKQWTAATNSAVKKTETETTKKPKKTK